MKPLNLSDVVEAGDFNRPSAGAYLCKIVNVTDFDSKEYLNIDYDFAEGEFKDYYKNLMERSNFWGGHWIRSYKTQALGFFKRMLSAVAKSNPDSGIDYKNFNNEKLLINKYIGLVLGEEEYEANDGTIKTRTYVYKEICIDDLRNGNYKVPDKKTIAPQSNPIPPTADFLKVSDSDEEGVPW